MIEQLRSLCRRARAERPDIERVILFGSFSRGRPGPRSDADLLVVLSESSFERRMDRIPDLLEVFSPAPVPLDIVPWTSAELEKAVREEDPWIAMVRKDGLDLC